MRTIIVLAALLLASLTSALEIVELEGTVRFQPPTQYEDGSPLNAATDIQKYSVFLGDRPGEYSARIDVPAGAEDATVSIPWVREVSGSDTVDVYVAMTATDTAGQESVTSNEVHLPFVVNVTQIDPEPPEVIEVELEIECRAPAGVQCTVTVN